MAFTPGMTIAAARRALAAELRRRQFDTPDLDARVLIGHALGLNHSALIGAAERALTCEAAAAIAAAAMRRLRYEPVARIVGSKEFWSLPLEVDAATLVPRPETETVVDATLAWLDDAGRRRQPLRLLDIGTGSGALLLALLSELPNASGIAGDVSAEALAVARRNAARLALVGRAHFVVCDMASAFADAFDVVVCNPPYVPRDTIATLAPGVREYEPRRALDGGADGLDAYRALAEQVPPLLAADGVFLVELGAGQAEPVTEIFEACGLAVAALRSDLNNIPRALTAVHHGAAAASARKKPLGLSRKTD